jgi:hypothetical protein
MRKLLLIFTLIILPHSALFAQSGLTYEVSLENQINSSSAIIEGKVISKKGVWNSKKTLIYTINLVQVYKSFKGNTKENIEIITLGGTVEDERLVVNPGLELRKDELGVFMLQKSSVSITGESKKSDTLYEVVSESQGFYKYILQDNKAVNPYVTFEKISQNFYKKIQSHSKQSPLEKMPFDLDQAILNKNKGQKKSAVITIDKISPLNASAGTQTVLTIDGDGFGNTKGEVFFVNANDGGATLQNVPPSDIISWNESKIEVYIPSHAGTGEIMIQDAASTNQVSSQVLSINFAVLNAFDGEKNYLTSLVDASGQGGYIWHMTNSFDADSEAKSSFTRAFDTWVCSSLVNWEIGSPTATDASEKDGENVIRFDMNDELPLGVVGKCLNYQIICKNDQEEVATVEIDLLLNKETNWNYGPEETLSNQFDFESVVLHELGHGLQLSHVLEKDNIMYYAISNGTSNRSLNDNAKAGSNFVLERSTASGGCSYNAMTLTECLDTDNDGVSDAKDQCSATPSGESVDSLGCSESQLDDDNDGVMNNKDICPNTPSGQTVNSDGCATSQLDSDNDGVTDDKDICANTPAGQTVNANGCATSQLDSDNDGVTDDKDTCANTPAGQTVNANGCATSQLDSDNDGVTDDKDTCVNTPTGQTVNANGCATSQLDSDNDGVTDDKDICANTPAGQTVNANGCATSQLDSDNDGVTDDKDRCPDTIVGDAVNAEGCSESQTLGVEDEKLDKSIKFYPNPVSHLLSVKSENILIVKIEIYSVLGVIVDEYDSGFENIQTAHLSKGIYVVKIYSEKGTTTRRLIKQ